MEKTEVVADIKDEIRQLKNWSIDLTTLDIDIAKIYDHKLSFEENQQKIREEINRLESIKTAQTDVNTYYAESELVSNDVLDKYYWPIRNSVDKICQGYTNLVFIRGRGGIGKSGQVEKYLKLNGVIPIPTELMSDKELNRPIKEILNPELNYYLEITGELSEAYLYRILYVFNNVILWFRDVNKLLKTLRSIDTLKAATDTKSKRLICNNNYSANSSDIPRQFVYTGRIIFDFNSLEGIGLKEDFEALRTRGDYIDINLSFDDISDIMLSIADADWKKEVTKYIIENYNQNGYDLFNLRTQWRAFKTYEFCIKNNKDWKIEIKKELNSNMTKVRAILYSLIGRKPVRTMELKKMLLRHNEVNSLRTAHRRVEEWLQIDELFRVSQEEKNFYVCIDPIKIKGEKK